MRILVCGGRTYTDAARVLRVLDALRAEVGEIEAVISGGAGGADTLAADWAALRDIDFIRVPAKWKVSGLSAGPIRNRRMLRYRPGLVIAFPGGDGTADMCSAARAAGIPVREVV